MRSDPSVGLPVADHRASAPSVVSVQGLTKRFGARTAVSGLDLEIPSGVTAGFIGPNGAGKTTTMGMLLGLVTPTEGEGTVLGQPLGQPAAYLGRVGALIESPAFWPGLSGLQNLQVVAAAGGLDTGTIPGVLDQVGLTGRASDRFGSFSLGMKQRLGIAAALLGDPQLLLLDEPTNGLDPVGINEMRQLIGSLGHRQRTVVVSSHILAELERVCDWLIIIDNGSLVYQGPADRFIGAAQAQVVLAAERAADHPRLQLFLRADGYEVLDDSPVLRVPVEWSDARSMAARLNRLAAEHDVVLAELHVDRPSLESHYLAVIEGAS